MLSVCFNSLDAAACASLLEAAGGEDSVLLSLDLSGNAAHAWEEPPRRRLFASGGGGGGGGVFVAIYLYAFQICAFAHLVTFGVNESLVACCQHK